MAVDRRKEPARPLRSWHCTFPMKLWSRNDWDTKHRFACVRKTKQERDTVGIEMLRMLNRAKPRPPLKVAMTRISPRAFDPDNLIGAFKHVQDAIATVVKVDDADARVKYTPAQEKGKPQQVRIEIEETI